MGKEVLYIVQSHPVSNHRSVVSNSDNLSFTNVLLNSGLIFLPCLLDYITVRKFLKGKYCIFPFAIMYKMHSNLSFNKF